MCKRVDGRHECHVGGAGAGRAVEGGQLARERLVERLDVAADGTGGFGDVGRLRRLRRLATGLAVGVEVLAAIDAKAVEVLFKAAGASIVANRKPRPPLPGARWNGQAGLAAPLGPTIPLDAPNASIRLHDEPYSKRPPQEVEALTDILGTKPARDGHFDLKYAEHQQVSSGLSGHKRRPASPGEDDKWINAAREGILSIQRRYIPPKQRKATSPQQGGEDRQHSGATKNKMK